MFIYSNRHTAIRAIKGVLFVSALVSWGLYGCGGRTSGPDLTAPAGVESRVGQVTPSGVTLGGTIRLNFDSQPSSLDPVRGSDLYAANAMRQIAEPLLAYDRDLNIIPAIAERYDVSEDRLVYTFHIRRGARFHDNPSFPGGQGREVTAHDVDYCFHRLLDPASLTRQAWLVVDYIEGAKAFNEGEAERISGITVLDDWTVEMRLNQPYYFFPSQIAHPSTSIYPREAVEHYGEDFFQNLVGTGPFRLVRWAPGQELLLARNQHYWREDEDGVQLPYLDGVRWRMIGDKKVEVLEFERGRLDLVDRIPQDFQRRVFDEDRNVRAAFQRFRVESVSSTAIYYLGFNCEREPFKNNRALRQAFNYAIDRESIVRYVLHNSMTPSSLAIPAAYEGYQSITSGYEYNLERARELLAEAGYPNGEGLSDITLQVNSGGLENLPIAEAAQSQLRDIGVNVRLQIVEWAQHLESIDNGDAIFFRLGWVGTPEIHDMFNLYWSLNKAPEGNNYFRYENPEFDRLYEQAIVTENEEERMRLYQRAEKVVVEDAPWIIMHHYKDHWLIQPHVQGVWLNPSHQLFLEGAWLIMPDRQTENERN